MSEIFRYEFQDTYFFEQRVWLALGEDDEGWWIDTFFHGHHRVAGGADTVEEFARAILEPREDEFYEVDFDFAVDSPGRTMKQQSSDGTVTERETTIDLDVVLGRDREGDPEELIVSSVGSIVGTRFGFQTGAELVDSPIDRPALEAQARRLLDHLAATGSAVEPDSR